MAKKLTDKQIAAMRAAAASVPDDADLKGRHFISWKHRANLIAGRPTGEDIREFRVMLALTQQDFAAGMRISIGTLRNWEQGIRHPEGPAVALLGLVARHPRLLMNELVPAGLG